MNKNAIDGVDVLSLIVKKTKNKQHTKRLGSLGFKRPPQNNKARKIIIKQLTGETRRGAEGREKESCDDLASHADALRGSSGVPAA